jgi:hypothetical protein
VPNKSINFAPSAPDALTGLSVDRLCPVCVGVGRVYLSTIGGNRAQRCPNCEETGLREGEVCEQCGRYGEIVLE